MSHGTKPTDLNYVVNKEKFKEFRLRAKLTLRQVDAATGIKPPNLSDFEHGRLLLPWPRLRKLMHQYDLDLFEIHDVLRLRILDPKLLQEFRRACRQVGTTPAQALHDFLLVFTAEVSDDR